MMQADFWKAAKHQVEMIRKKNPLPIRNEKEALGRIMIQATILYEEFKLNPNDRHALRIELIKLAAWSCRIAYDLDLPVQIANLKENGSHKKGKAA